MTLQIETRVGMLPPPVPHKMEVIPIHTSDRASFKRCRRYWEWTSPMRMNLTTRKSIHGISFPLWFGTGIHKALEMYYDPFLRRDPVETFLTWYNIQTLGGLVVREEYENGMAHGLKFVAKFDIVDGIAHTFQYQGLFDMLPDPDPEQFKTHYDLGVGMMTWYKQYAERHDNFAIIAAEHDFSIPLRNARNRLIRKRDPRDGKVKQVHYRGRLDGIIQNLENGRYGIMDHKSAAKADGDEYARKLEKDEQVTSYLWAGEVEAKMYGLEYENLDYVLYNTLWKGYPAPPEIVGISEKSPKGRPSMDRNQMTTPALWYQAVKDCGADKWLATNEKAQAYAQYLLDAGDDMFIRRDLVRRNRAEIQSVGQRVLMEMADMLDRRVSLYPNPTSHWSCLGCAMRAPCIARDDGSDWQQILIDNYESNYDR